MCRHLQVTVDARDPRALSCFWRDVLARAGVPEEQRDTRSAIEDPDGRGPRLFCLD